MMTSITAQRATRPAAARVRVAATLCSLAGLLGFASGAWLALVEPAVSDERFSFPLTAGDFTMVQVWFSVHHLGLLAGLAALSWAGVIPSTAAARRGWQLAVAGMAGLTVTEAIAIAAADSSTDAGIAGAVGALYGLDCIAIGVGLVLLGIAIVRSSSWTGWRRWVVLALGVWVFIPMFPALVATPTDGARWVIGGWMLLFAALGVALRRRGRAPAV